MNFDDPKIVDLPLQSEKNKIYDKCFDNDIIYTQLY